MLGAFSAPFNMCELLILGEARPEVVMLRRGVEIAWGEILLPPMVPALACMLGPGGRRDLEMCHFPSPHPRPMPPAHQDALS